MKTYVTYTESFKGAKTVSVHLNEMSPYITIIIVLMTGMLPKLKLKQNTTSKQHTEKLPRTISPRFSRAPVLIIMPVFGRMKGQPHFKRHNNKNRNPQLDGRPV